MNTEEQTNQPTEKEQKGRLSWMITVLELIEIVIYFAIAYKAMSRAIKHSDFVGMFESIRVAIIFLIISTIITTVLCFIPIFKSKGNMRWAIWNIIWVAFSIYSII